ncbi:hypothetical protein C922_04318 [Plasmodium inui San Antonio 1]|uniref:Uncharacterized protein n=1 Tax=Plasmodium inui San Antonio 1 TaxID=1237626 RepID=W7A1Y9_9APIC|nr:hypothetical protein C922_04318 [Plasmodium inui San Antonio 1]EUD65373.1 hypothetical protein C922_04318 [Plasmodium inui San Antonio 1]
MEQRRSVESETTTNDGSESEIKSSTDVFPSVIERLMGCSLKYKVNIVEFFNKVSLFVLALWILNFLSNQTNFSERWDNNSNDGKTGITPILGAKMNRSLSQVDVISMTSHLPKYCRPWDKPSTYTDVSQFPVKMPTRSMPPKGPNKMPSYGPRTRGPPNGRPPFPPNGYHQDGTLKRPPPHGPPNEGPQLPPYNCHQNDPTKGPPRQGPPNKHPQLPQNDYHQNDPTKGPPRQGPPNEHPKLPQNDSHQDDPLKGPPPYGPPSGSLQDRAEVSPHEGPPSGSPQSAAEVSAPRGPSDDSPSRYASERSKSPAGVNESEVYLREIFPPVPPRGHDPSVPVMFEHHKQFFQQTEANEELEFIDPRYENLKYMKEDRDNKILAGNPPSDKGENVNPANNIDIVRRPAPQQIRVQKVQEEEKKGILGEFADTIMSNIYEVEMERNPALELIKENIIDNIISANKGVKKNIDMITENIANVLKTSETSDWKLHMDLIKETIVEKIGSLDPEDIKSKCGEIKENILEKITENIESDVKPKINDIKDTINRNIETFEHEVIPQIGKTIKDCVTDTIGDISTGIEKTSETIKDAVVSNVKTLYDNVPEGIKDMAKKMTPDPNLTMEENLINAVTKSRYGFKVFGSVTNYFKNLGRRTKAVGSAVISFAFTIGAIGTLIGGGSQTTAVIVLLFIALFFAYYAIAKLLKVSILKKFKSWKRNFLKKMSKKNKKNELQEDVG